MIRFAPQAAKQTVVPQPRAPKPADLSGEAPAENAEPVAGLMLIPELDDTAVETGAKSSKPRGPKKQKAKAAPETAAQLDLNA